MASDIDVWLDETFSEGELSPGQRRVADVVQRNLRLAAYGDLAEVSERAGVNPSTAVRTAQTLGFSGWKDFQRELRARHLAGLSTEETLQEHGVPGSPLHEAIARDVESLRQTLEANTAESAESTIRTLSEARAILAVGLGSFAGPASVFAHLGSTMGYRIALETRAGVHLATAFNGIGGGDVVFLVNLWRTQRHILAAAEAGRRAGARIVVLTDRKRGPLAAAADHVVVVPSEGISFFQSVTAAGSAVYGLLAGMEAAHPDRSRAALRRTHELWKDLDVYAD
ncbi:MurR/RpiR family transcriptional regulator [Microbacterium betulae]|uniref:MurR/RpiR family transcriptional regulator n=1 Tax=Microbacterium betulae TaxID=2981139 RepID=A0AA97I5P9_9MICO|nr:MurR/RpiR family transcriptional regulator [Microbacterium sp. AB]WOF22994.1 MurR/RpiR family transcriptional regulator [Microbacterium sp. AB]